MANLRQKSSPSSAAKDMHRHVLRNMPEAPRPHLQPSTAVTHMCEGVSLFPQLSSAFPPKLGRAGSGLVEAAGGEMEKSVRRPDLVRPWKPHPPVGPDDLPPDLICLLSLILGLVGMLAKVLDDCVRVQWNCLLYLHWDTVSPRMSTCLLNPCSLLVF